jgi:hypothetical protein
MRIKGTPTSLSDEALQKVRAAYKLSEEIVPIVIYFWDWNIAMELEILERSSFTTQELHTQFHRHEGPCMGRSKDPSHPIFEQDKNSPVETTRGRALIWITNTWNTLT